MAADRARADEEDLKVSPFQKGEWEQTRPTELDVDYALLAEALGPAGAPVAEIHDATVVALAYVTGELAGALLGTVDDVLTKWEAAITARLSTPPAPATGAAAVGVRTAAESACTSDLERTAVRLVEEKDGVMELARGLRELPVVAAGAVNVSAFPRLRLALVAESVEGAERRSRVLPDDPLPSVWLERSARVRVRRIRD